MTPSDSADDSAGDIRSVLHAVSTVIRDWLGLVALESRLAGLSVARMLSLAIFAGLALFSAWLLTLGAVILICASLGYSLVGLLIAVALFNLVLGCLFISLIHKLSANLLFPATQQSFKRQPQPEEIEDSNVPVSPTV